MTNFLWEMAQMRLYGLGATPVWGGPVLGCLVAALMDSVGIALLYGIGILLFRRPSWVCHPGAREWLLALGLGFIGATVVERAALTLRWWHYGPGMPLVPGLGVGLVPLLQFLVLPPIVLFLAACCWLEKRCPEDR